MVGVFKRGVWVAISAAAVMACGADDAPVCEASACPPAHACGADGCEPILPPTTTGDLGRHTATATRPDGRLVVATYDATRRNLVVAMEQADGTDVTEVVDGWRIEDRALVDTDSGMWSDVAVDDTGDLHLVWFDADGGQLRYARRDTAAQRWPIEVVDGEGPEVRGTYASLAVAQGIVHVAYRDESARQLRYARRDADGTWTTRALDACPSDDATCVPSSAGRDYGEYAAIILVGARPRVAFYDRAEGDLKLATRRENGAWDITVLDGRDPETGDDNGDVGRFVSLALTQTRDLGAAYFDATRGALRYLSAGNPPITVDSGLRTDANIGASRRNIVGQHVALRYDGQGRAVMVYLDASALQLKMAVVSGAQTALRTLDALPAGGYISFDVTGYQQVRGAYGAWLADDAARTSLQRFDEPVATP